MNNIFFTQFSEQSVADLERCLKRNRRSNTIDTVYSIQVNVIKIKNLSFFKYVSNITQSPLNEDSHVQISSQTSLTVTFVFSICFI